MMGAVAMDSIPGGTVELDDFDRRLLDALQADNRRTGEELADIVTRRIGQVPGVLRTDTHVAFKMYSRHDLESLFAIGADQPAKRP